MRGDLVDRDFHRQAQSGRDVEAVSDSRVEDFEAELSQDSEVDAAFVDLVAPLDDRRAKVSPSTSGSHLLAEWWKLSEFS